VSFVKQFVLLLRFLISGPPRSTRRQFAYRSQKLKVRAIRVIESVERLIGARPGQKLSELPVMVPVLTCEARGQTWTHMWLHGGPKKVRYRLIPLSLVTLLGPLHTNLDLLATWSASALGSAL
jgi:hypothetical protein